MDAYRSAVTEVLGFAAFPVLAVVGLLAAAALTLRGQWREGVLLGLGFWVAAGLLKLAITTTWAAIASAAAIIGVRQVVVWALRRDATAGVRPDRAGSPSP